MRSTISTLLALAATATATTSSSAASATATSSVSDVQIPFFHPGMNSASNAGAPPHASIIGAEPGTTTMSIVCPSTATVDCLWEVAHMTYTIISTSIYKMEQSATLDGEILTGQMDCTSSKDITCTVVMPGDWTAEEASSGGSSEVSTAMTITTSYSGSDIVMQTATVIAGVEKLEATTKSAGSPTSTGSPTSAGQSGSPESPTETDAAGSLAVQIAAVFGVAGVAAAQLL